MASAVRLGEVSYAIALRSATEPNEEQVLFVSKEALDKVPRMIVTYNAGSGGGIGSIDWWWWLVIAGAAVFLTGAAFVIGSHRQQPEPIEAE